MDLVGLLLLTQLLSPDMQFKLESFMIYLSNTLYLVHLVEIIVYMDVMEVTPLVHITLLEIKVDCLKKQMFHIGVKMDHVIKFQMNIKFQLNQLV